MYDQRKRRKDDKKQRKSSRARQENSIQEVQPPPAYLKPQISRLSSDSSDTDGENPFIYEEVLEKLRERPLPDGSKSLDPESSVRGSQQQPWISRLSSDTESKAESIQKHRQKALYQLTEGQQATSVPRDYQQRLYQLWQKNH